MIKKKKYRLLLWGLLFDGLGMLSFMLPGIGEFADLIWAPMAGWLMTRMYKGNPGKIAGVIAFIEEIVPGLDIIPSFTLMWLYTYIFQKDKTIILEDN
ncbi:MAG: hypothetical protein WBN27_05980 [Eudoraea sp.]|uniref:hypothetical protein n=1 Tax=Eudoraea sp. TaxID=1979955 RepID=UPI003C748BB9